MKIKNNFLLSVALLSAFSSAQVSCSEDNRWSDEFKQAMINLTNSVLQVGLSVYTMKKTMKEASFTVYKAGTIKDNFESVAGNHEAKESFKDIIEYLKNPAKYHAIGAKVTSGILMTGNPGTGKTLLARSLAGEANCAFISASGSEFITKYQGSGTERVKRLFAQAREQYTWTTQNLKLVRKHIPCIIFIDEVDAIAGKRGGRGSSENDTTLNQLLTEMDGFVKGSQPIIVIAATNHPEALDSAVTRPGRFDRTLHIPLPDLKDRQAILNVHLKKVVHAADIDLLSIGQRTIGYSGADLAEII